MTPGKVVRLKADDAEDLRVRAAKGDIKAARIFLLYCAWKALLRDRSQTREDRAKALSALCSGVSVRWQTTSS